MLVKCTSSRNGRLTKNLNRRRKHLLKLHFQYLKLHKDHHQQEAHHLLQPEAEAPHLHQDVAEVRHLLQVEVEVRHHHCLVEERHDPVVLQHKRLL